MEKESKLIAKTFQGLEEVLAKELINLGANDVEIGRRMVSFTGDKEMMYRANFCLRTAVKVLKPIKEFKATDADDVYEVVRKMDWSQYMDNTNTFLVDSVVFSESFRHSKFVAYRVKDAIADYFRDTTGERPNVNITNPDFRINVHIAEDNVTISLDSSGESLHKRGYRVASVAAPLNEVLAAGMILLTGWEGECDFIDPMCGSGTLLIEAALIAQNIYPGVFRKEFAFEKWKDFDEDLFDAIYNDDSNEREFMYKIYGYDINRQAVAAAIENVKSASLGNVINVEQRDMYEFEQPLDKAIMITNPPYGERITTEDLLGLYEKIGERLKHAFMGNDAWILSYRDECFAKIGFRPSTRFALYNGALECEYRKYQVFDGKLKERLEEGLDIKSDEDRKRNLKFKPHKKSDDGEWKADRRKGSDDDDHYFKSRPYEERRKGKSNDWRNDRHKSKDDRREDRRKAFGRDMDDDDDLDLGLTRSNFKWGDRRTESSEERSYGRDRDFKKGDRDFKGGKGRDFKKGDRDFKGGKGRDFKKGDRDFKGGKGRDFKKGDRDFKGGKGRGDKPFRKRD